MNIEGIDLFVERITGQGTLNFILIHNAGGDHQFFKYQVEALKKHGNVILLDLPGHGASEVPTSIYSMDDLSQMISQICTKASLSNICLIGLNNGANIIINTVSKAYVQAHSIVLIDPPLFMNETFVGEINDFISQLEKSDYPEFVDFLANHLFIDTAPSHRVIAKNAFLKVDRETLQAMFRELILWDRQATNYVKAIDCPTLCILTDEHHCQYTRLKQEVPQFELAKVVGSKCWATLEVPEQVNAMIERFLKTSGQL